MGRQHTTWISDETWEQMKNIAGESVSERFRNAVKFADPVEIMRLRSLERQLEVAKDALYRINHALQRDTACHLQLQEIFELIEEVYWLVEQ